MTLTGFPLIDPECKALKRHQIVWCGMALCCITDYRADPVREPRSYTIRRTPELRDAA